MIHIVEILNIIENAKSRSLLIDQFCFCIPSLLQLETIEQRQKVMDIFKLKLGNFRIKAEIKNKLKLANI